MVQGKGEGFKEGNIYIYIWLRSSVSIAIDLTNVKAGADWRPKISWGGGGGGGGSFW